MAGGPFPRGLMRRGEPLLAALLVLAVAGFGLLDGRFLSAGNLASIAQQSAVIAIVAFAMTAVILARGIDISVGSTLAFAGIAGALVFRASGSSAARASSPAHPAPASSTSTSRCPA